MLSTYNTAEPFPKEFSFRRSSLHCVCNFFECPLLARMHLLKGGNDAKLRGTTFRQVPFYNENHVSVRKTSQISIGDWFLFSCELFFCEAVITSGGDKYKTEMISTLGKQQLRAFQKIAENFLL